MRYPAAEKLEIIRLVEQSALPVRRTLDKIGIPRTKPRAREIGLRGYAAPTCNSSLIGRYVMATAEHREPCDSRGSCTVLGAPGGEIPPGDSTDSTPRWRSGDGRSTPSCGRSPKRSEMARSANNSCVASNNSASIFVARATFAMQDCTSEELERQDRRLNGPTRR
jgi:hypothetical protein